MTVYSDKKSVVLLSGGLDSTVAFKKAFDVSRVVLVLTFDYGQRAAAKEIEAAASIARLYDVRHEVVKLSWLAEITDTAMVNRGQTLPKLSRTEIETGGEKTACSAKSVWVPNRNGVFINIAAAYCESLGAEIIITGFNAEEAATFPDNSPQFIDAVNSSLSYSILSEVEVISPTSSLDKAGIVRLGLDIDAPLDRLWSCYEGGEKMCGICEACVRLKRALEGTGSDFLDILF